MNKSDRNFIIAIGAIAVIFIGGYAGLAAYTGFTSPFSVVMSQSMQHDTTHSEIGIIDTGDVVIVKDPSKAEICSYIEGTQNGYESFGDYGSVIIYNRGNGQNPVIHRAILWLEYNTNTDTWSASTLKNYSGEWSVIDPETNNSTKNWSSMRGVLEFTNITNSSKNVKIDLDSLQKKSGYLTMGDNPVTNKYFDQSVGIINHLISADDIRSVAVMEIPWIGCIKLMIKGSDNLKYVTNSIPSLIMSFVTIILLVFTFDAVSLYQNQRGIRYKIECAKKYSR